MASLRQLQKSRGIPDEDITAKNARWKGLAEREQEELEEERSTRSAAWAEKYGEPLLNPRVVDDLGPGAPEWQGRTMYATNVGQTAAKWQGEGKAPIMIAENPEAETSAKAAGVKDVRKSVKFEAPPKPSGDDLLRDEITNGMWGRWLKDNKFESDPLKINPAKAGVEAGKKYDEEYPKPDPKRNPLELKQWEKDRAFIVKETMETAKADRTFGLEAWKGIAAFAKEERTLEQAKIAKEEKQQETLRQEGIAKKPTMIQAARMADAVMSDPKSFYLLEDEKADLEGLTPSDKELKLRYKQMLPQALQALNAQLSAAGMPILKEKFTPSKQGGPGWYEYLPETGGGGKGAPTSYPSKAPATTIMSEAAARQALTAKGVTGQAQNQWIRQYKAAGKVK
jgi:hypothetical protein